MSTTNINTLYQDGANVGKTGLRRNLYNFMNLQGYGAVGDGVTDAATALVTALAAITSGIILLPPGDYLLGSTATVDAGKGLYISPDTRLDIAAGTSLVINGTLLSGPAHQIFIGDGHVAMAEGYLSPRWWGIADAHPTYVELATAAFTYSTGLVVLDTEGEVAADDLETVSGTPADGTRVFLTSTDSARTITVKHNVGNITLKGAADYDLDSPDKGLVLQYDAIGLVWNEIARITSFYSTEHSKQPASKTNVDAMVGQLLKAAYGDEAQTHTGADLSALTIERNHILWTLAATSQLTDVTFPYDGTYVFHIYPSGNTLTIAATYKTDGSTITLDPAAGEIRIVIEQFNSRKSIVSVVNMEA